MHNRRVAICHQTISHGDAIGNDIFGMARLLSGIGFDVDILCDFKAPGVVEENVITLQRVEDINIYTCVVYHHSIYWQSGEELLSSYTGFLLLRFHNVTPPEYFSLYSQTYTKLCQEGIEQTKRLVALDVPHRWIADSEFNRADLLRYGAHPDQVRVVPPFNVIERFTAARPVASYGPEAGEFFVLSVGRIAPNKGHQRVLRIAASYRAHVADDLTVVIVGACDPELAAYRDELNDFIARNGLRCKILPHVAEDELIELFTRCHAYVSMSEHEGFCVPIIEAQAVGLPIVAMDAAAVCGTAGPSQLIAEPPVTEEDDAFYAALLAEVFHNPRLRRTVVERGYRNVESRFQQDVVENAFMEALLPLLGQGL